MPQASAPVTRPMPQAAAFSGRGKYLSLGLTLVVHVLLVAFLFAGIRWTTHEDILEVELVSAVSSPEALPPAPRSTPRPEPKPEPKPEPRVEPRLERKPDAPLPKPDIALKEDKKKTQPKPAPRTEPPPVDPFQKQLEQELKRATADRQQAESTRAADRELTALRETQAATARSKSVADYIGKIRSKIKSNIILPADIKGNPEAVYDVVQFPSGEILSVRLKKSSGHAGYDAAVERAILKSSPLPKPERSDLFERELLLRFHPQED